MVMESPPSPQCVGREFVRQYYTLLNQAPAHLHRFYNNSSSFIHGGLDPPNREPALVVGQRQIHQKIQQLNFRDCHAKIAQVDSQATLGNGVVVQVTGELSNGGQPMRRFTQTFVLAFQAPKKYYVHNDIFRYQDMLSDEEYEEMSRNWVNDNQTGMTNQHQNQSTNNNLKLDDDINEVNEYNDGSAGTVTTPLMNGTSDHIHHRHHVDDDGLMPQTAAQTIQHGAPPSLHQPQPPGSQPPLEQRINQSTIPETIQQTPSVVLPASVGIQQSSSSGLQPVSTLQHNAGGLQPVNSSVAMQTQQPPSSGGTSSNLLHDEGKHEAAQPQPPIAQIEEHNSISTSVQSQRIVDSYDEPTVEPEVIQSVSPPLSDGGVVEVKTYANLVKGSSSTPNQTYYSSVTPVNRSITPPSSTTPLGRREPRPPRDSQRNSFSRPADNNDSSLNNACDGGSGSYGGGEGDRRRNQYNDNHQLFLGNVPHNATEAQLKEIFGKFGTIVDLRVLSKAPTKSPNGNPIKVPNYGFITFEDPNSVQAVLSARPIVYPFENNVKLNVEEKKAKGGRGIGGGPSGGGGGGGEGGSGMSGGRGGRGGGRGGLSRPGPNTRPSPSQQVPPKYRR